MGVSACAVCDGALPRFRNKPLVVVGGGDSACEEGNYLTKFASNVHLVYRRPRDKMRASTIMAERLLGNPKVKPHWNTVVDEVLGDDEKGMTGVRLHNVVTGDKQQLDATGMFVAIGHTPNTKFLNGQVETRRARVHRAEGRRSARSRASRASSPPATSPTRSTSRPSPPPAWAARRRWTPSGGWRPTRSCRRASRTGRSGTSGECESECRNRNDE